MRLRGIPVEFVAGRRRTSRAALDVVRESMEAVNAELCAALGEIAVPVFGDRTGFLAVPVPPLGCVGDPLPCRPQQIVAALHAGFVPVVAPIAVGPLNVNAEMPPPRALGWARSAWSFSRTSPVSTSRATSSTASAPAARRRCSTTARSKAASSRSCALRRSLRATASRRRSAARR